MVTEFGTAVYRFAHFLTAFCWAKARSNAGNTHSRNLYQKLARKIRSI